MQHTHMINEFMSRAALYAAAWSGCTERVIELLYNPETDVNQAVAGSKTPLYIATARGHPACVDALLADPRADANIACAHGFCGEAPPGLGPISGAIPGAYRVRIRFLETTYKIVHQNACEAHVVYHRAFAFACMRGSIDSVRLLLKDGSVYPIQSFYYHYSPITAACWRTDCVPLVELLLADGRLDINSRDLNGRTALHYACVRDRPDLLEMLLRDARTDVNARDDYDDTPLIYAVRNTRINALITLLKDSRVDVLARNSRGATAIHVAARYSKPDALDILLADGRLDPNTPDRNGRTPLHAASREGIASNVRLLLSTERVDALRTDLCGNNALHDACFSGHEGVVRLLAEDGTIPMTATSGGGLTPIMCAVQSNHLDVVRTLQGLMRDQGLDTACRTADMLQHAFAFGSASIVSALLPESDVDVNSINAFSKIPLLSACELGQAEILNAMVTSGRARTNITDARGRTPLHLAAGAPHVECMRLLLRQGGIDVNAQDDAGKTPLMLACISREVEAVTILLARADIDLAAKSKDGCSALHCAVCRSEADIVQRMLDDERVDVNATDDQGKTPLFYAIARPGGDGYPLFTACPRIDVRIKDKKGNTALHAAASATEPKWIGWLLQHPHTDVNARNNLGRHAGGCFNREDFWLCGFSLHHIECRAKALFLSCPRVDLNLRCSDVPAERSVLRRLLFRSDVPANVSGALSRCTVHTLLGALGAGYPQCDVALKLELKQRMVWGVEAEFTGERLRASRGSVVELLVLLSARGFGRATFL